METEITVKIIACIIFGIMFGPLVSVAITPIFCFLRKIFFVPFIREGLREKAQKKGHVVEATLQKHHTLRDKNGRSTMKEMGTYSYQVNGKNYKYRCISSNRLPRTITLFYLKKPRKATCGGDLGNWESPWFKFYLIISLIAAIVSAVVFGMVIWSLV